MVEGEAEIRGIGVPYILEAGSAPGKLPRDELKQVCHECGGTQELNLMGTPEQAMKCELIVICERCAIKMQIHQALDRAFFIPKLMCRYVQLMRKDLTLTQFATRSIKRAYAGKAHRPINIQNKRRGLN